MKHFAIKMLLLSFLCVSITFNATAIDNVVIAFLKEQPTQKILNCTGEELMNLLTDESLEFIESIECKNIDIIQNRAGVRMNITANEESSSNIELKFKNSHMPNAIRITGFGMLLENSNTIIEIICNDQEVAKGNFTYGSKMLETKYQQIYSEIKNNKWQDKTITNKENFTPSIPIKSITINIPSQSDNNTIQFYGIKIYYDGVVDNSDIETAVTEFQAKENAKSIEYFDMMGRKLPEAPAKGIYIRKCGSKVEKLTASCK